MFATTNVEYSIIVAIILFCVSGVLRFSSIPRRVLLSSALVAFGLAVFALSFIINP